MVCPPPLPTRSMDRRRRDAVSISIVSIASTSVRRRRLDPMVILSPRIYRAHVLVQAMTTLRGAANSDRCIRSYVTNLTRYKGSTYTVE